MNMHSPDFLKIIIYFTQSSLCGDYLTIFLLLNIYVVLGFDMQ